jgi:hypothetical protein
MASETFQNLSEQLPPAERKQLLEKIRSSINLEQRDADSIVAVRSPREEMESRLRSEILTLGFLVATVVTDSPFLYRQN